MTLIECIPNFSEGRRRDVIDEIAAAVTRVDGVHLLDVQSDATQKAFLSGWLWRLFRLQRYLCCEVADE